MLPKVRLTVAPAVAGVERLKEPGPVMLSIVVPGLMPGPKTAMPAESPVVLVTRTEELEAVVVELRVGTL